MIKEALGIIETRGLTALVEAADAMVKAANVELIGVDTVSYTHLDVYKRQKRKNGNLCAWMCMIFRRSPLSIRK